MAADFVVWKGQRVSVSLVKFLWKWWNCIGGIILCAETTLGIFPGAGPPSTGWGYGAKFALRRKRSPDDLYFKETYSTLFSILGTESALRRKRSPDNSSFKDIFECFYFKSLVLILSVSEAIHHHPRTFLFWLLFQSLSQSGQPHPRSLLPAVWCPLIKRFSQLLTHLLYLLSHRTSGGFFRWTNAKASTSLMGSPI
jgi:hypothetical protein